MQNMFARMVTTLGNIDRKLETPQRRKESAAQCGSQGDGDKSNLAMRPSKGGVRRGSDLAPRSSKSSARKESRGAADGMRPRARITSCADRGEQVEPQAGGGANPSSSSAASGISL